MTESADKFAAAISKNAEWKEILTARLEGVAPNEQAAVTAAFANEKGFALTEADLQGGEGEMELDELETVAGGDHCACAIYGEGNSYELRCKCIYGGEGEMLYQGFGSQGGCICLANGLGASNRH